MKKEAFALDGLPPLQSKAWTWVAEYRFPDDKAKQLQYIASPGSFGPLTNEDLIVLKGYLDEEAQLKRIDLLEKQAQKNLAMKNYPAKAHANRILEKIKMLDSYYERGRDAQFWQAVGEIEQLAHEANMQYLGPHAQRGALFKPKGRRGYKGPFREWICRINEVTGRYTSGAEFVEMLINDDDIALDVVCLDGAPRIPIADVEVDNDQRRVWYRNLKAQPVCSQRGKDRKQDKHIGFKRLAEIARELGYKINLSRP